MGFGHLCFSPDQYFYRHWWKNFGVETECTFVFVSVRSMLSPLANFMGQDRRCGLQLLIHGAVIVRYINPDLLVDLRNPIVIMPLETDQPQYISSQSCTTQSRPCKTIVALECPARCVHQATKTKLNRSIHACCMAASLHGVYMLEA
jgi:hypothetical protein